MLSYGSEESMVLHKIGKILKEKGGNISVSANRSDRMKGTNVFWSKRGRDRLDFSLVQSGSLAVCSWNILIQINNLGTLSIF